MTQTSSEAHARLPSIVGALLTIVLLHSLSVPAVGAQARGTRVRYIGGVWSSPVAAEDWSNLLTVESDGIVVRFADGQLLKIPWYAVTFLGYSREASRNDGIIGLPAFPAPIPVFPLSWVHHPAVHLVAIEFSRANDVNARILLEADKRDYVSLLRALSTATHVRVAVAAADRSAFTDQAITDLTQPLRTSPGVPVWRTERLVAPARVTAMAFSPDGDHLAATLKDGTIIVWKVADRSVVWHLPKGKQRMTELAFGPKGQLAVWRRDHRLVTIWDIARRQVLGTLSGEVREDIAAVVFSPQVEMVAVVSQSSFPTGRGRVRLWRLPTVEAPGELTVAAFRGGVVFNAAGTTLTSWNWDGQVTVHDIITQDPSQVSDARQSGTIAFSAEAGLLASSRTNRRSIALWSMPGGRMSGEALTGHFGEMLIVQFNADGQRLLTAAPGHALIWNVVTRAPMGQCHTASGMGRRLAVLNSSGTRIASALADGATIDLCSMETPDGRSP